MQEEKIIKFDTMKDLNKMKWYEVDFGPRSERYHLFYSEDHPDRAETILDADLILY